MHQRLAKKIIARVQGNVSPTSYRREQVEAAFRVMNTLLTPELLRPWVDVKEDTDLLARQERNRLRREASIQAIEARRQGRAERRARAIQRNQAMIAARKAFAEAMILAEPTPDAVIAKHVQTKAEPVPAPEPPPAEAEPIEPESVSETDQAHLQKVYASIGKELEASGLGEKVAGGRTSCSGEENGNQAKLYLRGGFEDLW